MLHSFKRTDTKMLSYLVYSALLIMAVFITPFNSLATTSCTSDANCGLNGVCATSTSICHCTKAGYVTVQSDKPCAYEQKNKLTAFLLSFFFGGFGADWFYLSAGNGGYIAAGVFKLLTLGGAGIWILVDWIRLLVDAFPDGQGVSLKDWK